MARVNGGTKIVRSVVANFYRTADVYTGRILKGEKPASLPAQRSTRVDLVIAKTLGLTFPITLLALADEVFE